MIDVSRDSQTLAIEKIQEMVDQAVGAKADTVTIEYAKEGGLEVFFMTGNTGVGGILVDQTLEMAVMTLIYERAGLEENSYGMLQWESYGQNLEIRVEEFDSFGETAYTLTFPNGR